MRPQVQCLHTKKCDFRNFCKDVENTGVNFAKIVYSMKPHKSYQSWPSRGLVTHVFAIRADRPEKSVLQPDSGLSKFSELPFSPKINDHWFSEILSPIF